MKSTFGQLSIAVMVLAATLGLGGCATQTPAKPAGIEQRIETAHTPEDHHRIAAEYEKQAAGDKATAKLHRDMAVTYRDAGPKGSPGAMAMHCNNLAKLYQQAADENLELAKLHHEVAADLSLSSTRQ